MTVRRRSRWPIAVVVVAGLVAVLADVVAADRPLLLHLDGETYVAPNLVDRAALADLRGDRLRAAMTAADWALWPPIAHDPVEVRTAATIAPLAPPSSGHLLGTDDRGRDVAARLIHGTRTTAIVAAATAGLALVVAILLAVVAAGSRRAVAAVILGACDAIAAVPPIVTVIAAQGLWGHGSVVTIVVLIALPRAADTARLTTAALRAALAAPWSEAARAAGAAPLRLLVRHALPHAAPVLATATALTAATAVLSEAALAFVGFGAPAPTPSWGELLAQAVAADLRWWLSIPAGLAITVVTAALLALARVRPAAR